MKTFIAIPAKVREVPTKSRVKITLLKGIIYLTSNKFAIFVNVVASIMAWYGAIIGDSYLMGCAGLIFLAGFAPWAWRETARNIRQDKLGVSRINS